MLPRFTSLPAAKATTTKAKATTTKAKAAVAKAAVAKAAVAKATAAAKVDKLDNLEYHALLNQNRT